MNYVMPTLNSKSFTCAFCGVFAQQHWSDSLWHRHQGNSNMQTIPLSRCFCQSCRHVSYWDDESESQILPRMVAAPMPHPDLPEACLLEYGEARNVVSESPRAAAALLRLCAQKLMVALGQKGKNIDEDIAALVKKGLPDLVQKALDICRVTGNNAVHPGELSSEDTAELTGQIFGLINFIVAQTIERQKSIEAMYGKLPGGARAAIDKRNAKAATPTEGA